MELGYEHRLISRAYVFCLFYGTVSLQIMYSDKENLRQEEMAGQLSEGKKPCLLVFSPFLFVLKPLKLLADGQEI